MTTIRLFRESDTSEVVALWREVFPDEAGHNDPEVVIRQKLRLQRELFFVGENNNGVIAGTIVAGYDGHRGWLYAVAVHPTSRRRGLGTALIRHAEQALLALGATKINLQVRASNAVVVAFYRSLGYQIEERISMGKLIGSSAER